MKYFREQNEFDNKQRIKMSRVETEKFTSQVESTCASTVQTIATGGLNTQIKLLQSMSATNDHSSINSMDFVGQDLFEDRPNETKSRKHSHCNDYTRS